MTAPGHADAGPAGPSPADLPHLRRCVELAAEAVDAGDFPFGSVLVAGDGSSEQLIAWLGELGVSPSPVVPLAVNQVAPGLVVQGPMPGLDEQVRELHRRFRAGS